MKKGYVSRANWIRAAVLGSNDGIISTTSLVIGVAAAGSGREALMIAAVAGMVAGATSMTAGEYVSVCSQTDVEKSDIARKRKALEENAAEQLEELTEIYRQRGLSDELAERVAHTLSERDALEAHTRDVLGINDNTRPRPLQASLASAASYVLGSMLPLIVSMCTPLEVMIPAQYLTAIVWLGVSGACAAKLGGCKVLKSVLRICLLGTASMVLTAVIGWIFGVQL